MKVLHKFLPILLFLPFFSVNAQEEVMKKDEMAPIVVKGMKIAMDTMACCSTPCYKNHVSLSGRYLFNSMQGTRTMLENNGFLLGQEAWEFQLRLFQFPKVFYSHQLGTLTDAGRYVSVTGFGLKEDIRFPIVNTENVWITPYIELGGGIYRMNLVRNVSTNSISTALNGSVDQTTIDNFVVSGDVGLELGFGFAFDQRRFRLLMNGGYISNVPLEWRIAGSLAFSEKLSLSTPYAGVTLQLEMQDMDCCK
ncbi:MAG: hypothetical protein LW630_05470 [Saprospiraceae bacterium]|nr:hypothetical protein [Saprospiraceae bacterium]